MLERTWRRAVSTGCVLWTLLAAVWPASGQAPVRHVSRFPGDERAVSLSERNRTLSDILASLSGAINIDVIADGVPRKTTATIEFKGTAREAVERVASEFDLTWTVSRAGVILFQKRFKDQREIPQLNQAEMEHVASDSLRIITSLGMDPRIHVQSYFLQLGATFSPEQMETLRAGENLPVAALSPEQSALVAASIFSFATSRTYHGWNVLHARLAALKWATIRNVPAEQTNPYTHEVFQRPWVLFELQDPSGRWVNETLIQYPPFIKEN